jgi:hypothetical protein
LKPILPNQIISKHSSRIKRTSIVDITLKTRSKSPSRLTAIEHK